ncbi:MAG: Double zinc ribbon [Firmicutes bacterium ADurb.Bin182]|nr:MAG: Double zinc ribbon [Firmicutes bacterium ADurb.Bin182]
MKGKELVGVLKEYVESSSLLRFLSKLAIISVFICPLVFLLGQVLMVDAVSQFTNLSFYVMLLSIALLFVGGNWLILMISCGIQALLELFVLLRLLIAFGFFSINVLTDFVLFGLLCLPAVIKFIASYKATHVPKPKAPKPVKVMQPSAGGAAAGFVCGRCGAAVVNPEAVFCNSCGNKLEKPAAILTGAQAGGQDVCPVCKKAYLSADALFCNGCGAKRPAPVTFNSSKAPSADKSDGEASGKDSTLEAESAAEPQNEQAQAVYCPCCGKQCGDGVSFCTSCGTPVKITPSL